MGIIIVVLFAMQVYMKRGIQAVIKVAADQIGEQKKGLVDVDYKYEWKWKGFSDISASTNGEKATIRSEGGAVSYGTNETSKQKGILSWGLWTEKE